MVAKHRNALLVITITAVAFLFLANWWATRVTSEPDKQQALVTPAPAPPQLQPLPDEKERQSSRRAEASTNGGDPKVRTVSHFATVSVAMAAVGQAGASGPRITKISDGTYAWPVARMGQDIYLFKDSRAEVKLHTKDVSGRRNIFLTHRSFQNAKAVSLDFVDGQAHIGDELPESGGRVEVRLVNTGPPILVLVIPPPQPTIATPVITDVATNAFVRPSPVMTPTRLYGSEPSLTLVGRNRVTDAEYTFLQTQLDEEGLLELQELSRKPSVRSTPGVEGGWEATVSLSLPLKHYPEPHAGGTPPSHRLLLLSTHPDEHVYAEPRIEFQKQQQAKLTQPPAIAFLVPGSDKDLEREDNNAYLKATEWPVEITLPSDAIGPDAAEDILVVLRSSERSEPVGTVDVDASRTAVKTTLTNLAAGRQRLWAEVWQGSELLNIDNDPASFEIATVHVRAGGLQVERVEPQNFGTAPGIRSFKIHFSGPNRLAFDPDDETQLGELKKAIELLPSDGAGGFAFSTKVGPEKYEVDFDPGVNVVTVKFKTVEAALYQLTLDATVIEDLYGNLLEGEDGREGSDYVTVLGQQTALAGVVSDEPTVRPGISGATGPYVPFPEFTAPRTVPDGFNPHDKVETRVARLYFYRDAHRVAQIINRRVKSYNRHGVDMQHQLADKSRTVADQTTAARQAAERKAIEAAQATRRIESQLEAAQRSLDQTLDELTSAQRVDQPEAIDALDAAARGFARQIETLQDELEDARVTEVEAREDAARLESDEQLARAEQFRREVAAAHADPDTYAPGRPRSPDPVEQVSVSVIGEGLIHLRGPIKGINTIRLMIDQIDSPLGQTRISVHTVQINGEDESRMEDVANIVQMYIDQSRFLTLQSSEMLRRAVVQVAARKAEEARHLYPGESQADRDRRYLDAFFGRDFINELVTIDSEFLETGNKVLSLHSMDTTSLASALNLMALAKNSVREEILAEFDMMVQTDLPAAEAHYLDAGLTAGKKHKLDLRHPPKFYPLAQRARFESLRAFFQGQILHDDTMTPLQREFIRLAQIFKSRLVTEIEYKQRVMERAVIEERLGDREKELLEARRIEKLAEDALRKEENATEDQQLKAVVAVQKLTAKAELLRRKSTAATAMAFDIAGTFGETIKAIPDELMRHREESPDDARNLAVVRKANDELRKYMSPEGVFDSLPPERIEETLWDYRVQYVGDEESAPPIRGSFRGDDGSIYYYKITKEGFVPVDSIPENARSVTDPEVINQWIQKIANNLDQLREWRAEAWQFELSEDYQRRLHEADEAMKRLGDMLEVRTSSERPNASDAINGIIELQVAATQIAHVFGHVHSVAMQLIGQLRQVTSDLATSREDLEGIYARWLGIEAELLSKLDDTQPLHQEAATLLTEANRAFEDLLRQSVKRRFAERAAEEARRPLDHKKFLDMLIDQLEEKYIELLEGTRAHTANVDNYLKRLTTALDDDFNTQFYNPTFRYVRETSTYWDVQFGQTETTTILTNNRQLAKVSPSATMEFDLPKRDILINEALNGAMANVQDFGALLNDPTFLAAAELEAPQSVATPPPGSTSGFGVVRDVLPGLDSGTAEDILARSADGRPQFGSNLENLIPDPAIYKFETGTGFEIRPVIQPDGQAVVFDFNYMYTTNIREPVRADEKHLGRVKRHYIDTDVQLSNFELREVSRYTVALKAARTSRGVPLLEDIPVVGALWRPLPSQESSLQQNVILAQATIFPTLFDLMGLRWAPAVADLDPLRLANQEFIARGRHRELQNRVYDHSSTKVDEFLRIPEPTRRPDLYRTQESVPQMHPNGYQGPGLDLQDSQLQEGYQPERAYPEQNFIPGESKEGAPFLPGRRYGHAPGTYIDDYPLEMVAPGEPDPEPLAEPVPRVPIDPASPLER